MPNLHLLPIPDCRIIDFPVTARNCPEAVIAQLSNIQAHLIARNGSHLGRSYFTQAALWLIARTAMEENDVALIRRHLMEEFDDCVDMIANTKGFSGMGPGAA
jgi:hypothetical protein